MKTPDRDLQILQHLLTYCNRIEQTVERFGEDKDIFLSDRDYIDSVSMNLLQIGELAGKFSDGFIERCKSEIDWRAIRGMRNLFAHAYGTMDIDRIWDTVIYDVPQLKEYCMNELDIEPELDSGGPTLTM